MSARGYYGGSAERGAYAPPKSGGGWKMVAVVAGLGVVIYMLLPTVGPKPQLPPSAPEAPAT